MNVQSAIRSRRVLLTLATVVLAIGLVAVPQVRWRVQVVALHLSGKIPDITLGEVLHYMGPGSDQSMRHLIARRNPHAAIRNFKTSEKDIAAGAQIFLNQCSDCHGPDGTGSQVAPALIGREFEHGNSDWAVYRTIRDGVASTAMPATPDLSEDQRWQVISFVRSLDAATSAQASGEAVAAIVHEPVSFAEVAAKAQPDADWLTYSGSYAGTRHSSLHGIDRSNVDRLALKWLHQFDDRPVLEVTPLVRNGLMFISAPGGIVQALDAATGRTVWSWRCTLPNDLGDKFGRVTRGLALLDDKVFYAAQDAKLYALDAATGKQLWQAVVEPDHKIYYITGAPLAFRDVVVTGTSTEKIGRGVIAAFDVKTGKERWRFHTVPGAGERGNETWEGDSWRAGGGPAWLTGSYDPELDLLYWGIGNPKPDYDAGVRRGDNLYTNSVVALRGATGELVWHFQFVPADNRDWGANQIPVLVNHRAGRHDREAHALGESQRLLLRVRPGAGHVQARQAVRTGDVDTGSRRERSAAGAAGRQRQRRALAVSRQLRRDTLVVTDVLPAARSVDRSSARTGNGLLPVSLQPAALERPSVLHIGARAECKNRRSGVGAQASSAPYNELDAGPGLDGRRTRIRQRSIHVLRAGHR